MKKKMLWCAGIIVWIPLVIFGILRYTEIQRRQADPAWKLAEQIYKTEIALKEVDEDAACKSISKVTPYTYADPAGNTIVYYCCQTAYLEDVDRDETGLNTDAIGIVIDFAKIRNRQECTVNTYAAFRCEMDKLSYLCWTISPEISCVIEYSADVNNEADIFRMAQSVQLPQ